MDNPEREACTKAGLVRRSPAAVGAAGHLRSHDSLLPGPDPAVAADSHYSYYFHPEEELIPRLAIFETILTTMLQLTFTPYGYNFLEGMNAP